MNRKLNSVLFIVAATVGNLLLMVLLMTLSLVALSFLRGVPDGVLSVLTVVLFIGSIAATYWIYHRLMRYLAVHYDLEEHFAPLFKRPHRSRERSDGARKRPGDRE